ncbi:mucin-7-like [Bos indicus x Bos taurus]|uniref:mucin-7-like n=1 Tax=Bos indicus x Bos taurus TaxID=30522 RepID=UPI000F7D288F|nr:mucin-7-like [Bos indicus x Bos taurus]
MPATDGRRAAAARAHAPPESRAPPARPESPAPPLHATPLQGALFLPLQGALSPSPGARSPAPRGSRAPPLGEPCSPRPFREPSPAPLGGGETKAPPPQPPRDSRPRPSRQLSHASSTLPKSLSGAWSSPPEGTRKVLGWRSRKAPRLDRPSGFIRSLSSQPHRSQAALASAHLRTAGLQSRASTEHGKGMSPTNARRPPLPD